MGGYFNSNGGPHGFLLSGNRSVFANVDDPNGMGLTDPLGISASAKIVGVYDDGAGDHGFLATKQR